MLSRRCGLLGGELLLKKPPFPEPGVCPPNRVERVSLIATHSRVSHPSGTLLKTSVPAYRVWLARRVRCTMYLALCAEC